jgi:bifunctional non-homologous end joining protein LigD
VSDRLVFIRPLAPSSAVSPPTRTQWLHEPKWDGFRFQVVKNGSTVRFYSRNGTDYTERLPGMRKSLAAELPADSAIIDGVGRRERATGACQGSGVGESAYD